MKANKKVMAALLAAMMSVSAGAAVVSAVSVSGPGADISGSDSTTYGWQGRYLNIGGKRVAAYYYQTGARTYASGWQLIDGNWYYFARYDSGKLYVNGEQNIGNGLDSSEPRYVLMDTKREIFCADKKTHTFRFDSTGKMITGWYRTSNAQDPTYGDAMNWEYYSPSTGAQQKGWIKVGANWFYMTDTETVVEYKENGQWMQRKLPANTLMMNGTYKFMHGSEAGKTYSFAANGVLLNQGQGWVQEGGNWYWIQEDGTRFAGKKDLIEINQKKVWMLNKDSWNLINGKYYLFDDAANGSEMLTGWQQALNANGEVKWYYMTGNGDCVLNSWVFVGNNWYLLNASGEMVTGFAVRGGKTYLLNPTAAGSTDDVIFTSKYVPYGAMVTGAVSIKDENGKYMEMVFDSNGALVSINNNFVAPGTIPTLPDGITIPTPGM